MCMNTYFLNRTLRVSYVRSLRLRWTEIVNTVTSLIESVLSKSNPPQASPSVFAHSMVQAEDSVVASRSITQKHCNKEKRKEEGEIRMYEPQRVDETSYFCIGVSTFEHQQNA